MAHRHLSAQHLNGIRSAIASVFKVIHKDKPPIASQETIVAFFSAKRHSEIRIPTKTQLTTWDSDIMVHYIKKHWPVNNDLSLFDLQLKTIFVLGLFSSARPRSEIGGLQYRDIHFEFEDNEISEMVIFFREAKETQVKPYQLGVIEEVEVCPVRTLYAFHSNTRHLRGKLPDDHSLFLAFFEQPAKTRPASSSTVASWIKRTMSKAGIDPRYKPHSLRAASSTKAVERGISIKDVKQHANWSLKSNTFEKYYYKPTAQKHNSTRIATSIFSTATENHTTFGEDSQSTRIVEELSTNNNTNVDEEDSKNVVITHPWYRRILPW